MYPIYQRSAPDIQYEVVATCFCCSSQLVAGPGSHHGCPFAPTALSRPKRYVLSQQVLPYKLTNTLLDFYSIAEVARTITISFSRDPLIQWLRPTAAPWAGDQPDTQRWQERRIRRAVLEGMVFKSACVGNLAQLFPPKRLSSKQAIVGDDLTSGEADAGAAVLLFPPSRRLEWTPKRILMALKLWLLDKFSPVSDHGTDEKVCCGYSIINTYVMC